MFLWDYFVFCFAGEARLRLLSKKTEPDERISLRLLGQDQRHQDRSPARFRPKLFRQRSQRNPLDHSLHQTLRRSKMSRCLTVAKPSAKNGQSALRLCTATPARQDPRSLRENATSSTVTPFLSTAFQYGLQGLMHPNLIIPMVTMPSGRWSQSRKGRSSRPGLHPR